MTTLKSCRPTEPPVFDELTWILMVYSSGVGFPPAHACAAKNSNIASAIFFTGFLVSVYWNKESPPRTYNGRLPNLLDRLLLPRP